MSPITLLSPVSNPRNVLPSPQLFGRSLSPRSQLKQSFFGTLFNALSSLAVVGGIMKNINSIWNFVYPRHIRNTQAAQDEVDTEYIAYHTKEWQDKHRRAKNRARTQLIAITAVEKPDRFVRQYILDTDEGSSERKVMTGILKVFNPEYYEENQDVLGETIDLDEYEVSSAVPDVDEDIYEDEIPQ